MEHITQGGNGAQVLTVLNLLNYCSLTTNNYRRNWELWKSRIDIMYNDVTRLNAHKECWS
jgi:hypothetical protein